MNARTLNHCWLGLCLLACACTQIGTETDNPITEFRSSECKGSSSETALTVAALEPLRPEVNTAEVVSSMAGPEYDGLFCIAWDATDHGVIAVELYNLEGGCHVVWDARARSDESGLELGLQPHGCIVAGCGACTYDLRLSFDGIDTSAPLSFAVRELPCFDSAVREIAEHELPLHERRKGVICRPQPRAYSGGQAHCGGAHLPVCSEDGYDAAQCSEQGAAACAEGLRCEPGEPDVCLSVCEEDDDCPLAIERCDDGVCRLRETL